MTMKSLTIVLFLMLLLTGKFSLANGTGTVADTAGFTINSPQGWDKNDTLFQGQRFVFIRQPKQGPDDNFMENVNVITQEVGDVTIDDYVKMNLASMEQGLEEYKKGISGTYAVNGYELQSFRYSYTYGSVPIDAIVYFMIQNGTAYVITCSAHGGELKKYEKVFQDIVGSFRIRQ
jgi:hypothetical protein